MALELRTSLADSDLTSWILALHTGFLRPPETSEREVELRRGQIDLSRTQGVFDGGRCVATFRSFAQRLTAVGGGGGPPPPPSQITGWATHPPPPRRKPPMGHARPV
ncbi:GNAT family N-acetyltransferase, partial [Streptomyces hygroscopicus]|uniref:GNAT family N-acetyltransferase n=1 Tax=Streptomyces hygroscopicus TaxID=1912 RepID=UPI0036A7A3A6